MIMKPMKNLLKTGCLGGLAMWTCNLLAATVSLPSLSVGPGASFALPISVNTGASALGRYDFDVRYDPAVLQVSVVSGGSGEFSDPLFYSTNTVGRILLSDENLTSLTSPTGSNVVAQISFQVIGGAGSTTSVYFASTALLDTDAVSLTATNAPAAIQIAGLPAILSVEGANVESGIPFVLPLKVDGGTQPLGRYEAELQYNTNNLRLVGVAGIAPFVSPLVNSNVPGKILLSADNLSSITSPTGLVSVADLTWLAVGGINSTATVVVVSSSIWNTDASALGVTNQDGMVLVNLDSDGDNLPDAWELRFFATMSHNGATDSDGDGVSDYDEYVADTNPTNALSYLRITSVQPISGGFVLNWQGGVTATQWVQRIGNLDSNGWMNISTSMPPTPVSGSFTDVLATNTAGFYRIRAER